MKRKFKQIAAVMAMIVAMITSVSVTASAYGAESEGILENPYDILESRMKAELAKIADGTTTSATITVDYSDLGINPTDIQQHVKELLYVLYRDCTYELYWWGETGTPYASGTTLTQSFSVAPDYRGADEYTVDPDKIAAAKKSIANADAIVEKYKNYSDKEKLRAYFDEIRSLCEYDYDAFNASMSGQTAMTIGSNPWNLTYVFDGDPDTKVICSGFSKAFKYLCDKSTFTGDVNCYCTSGILGEGSHMWNTVTYEGKNYLVDATIGHFMLKAVSGSIEEGYKFENNKVYSYDEITLGAFNRSSLTIEIMDWTLSSGTLTLWYDGEFGFRFANSPFAEMGVKKLILRDSTSIADYAFFQCGNLEEVVLTDSVKSIGDFAFQECTKLKAITMPYSVTELGSNAFSGCSSLASVTIPSGITEIGDYTFYNCTSLKTATMPDSLKSIGAYAFCGCEALTAAEMPSGVTSLGEYVFFNCKALTKATIPAGIKKIPERAFYGCAILSDCTIPSGVTAFGAHAFSGCTALNTTISGTITEIDVYAFNNCSSLKGAVKFAPGITEIPEYAFFQCGGITELTLPDNLTTIGKYAFYKCSSLKTLNAPLLGKSLGYYFGAEDTGLNGTYIPENLTTLQFTKGTAVPDNYLINCDKITSVSLPSGITSLGSYGFSGCKALADINLPDSVTSLGTYAFCNCTSLTKIAIPAGVKKIPERAFSGCALLSDCTIPSGVTAFGPHAFFNCSKLNTTISGTITEIGTYAFNNCSSLKGTIRFAEGIKEIPEYAFSKCSGITELTLPNSLTTIGKSAFYQCSSLKTLNAPLLGISLGYYFGAEDTGLNGSYIPETLQTVVITKGTAVPDKYFQACKNLKSVTLGEGIKSIGTYAFFNCLQLTGVKLPDSLTEIKERGFSGCDALTEVTIPSGVTTIGTFGFGFCDVLAKITFDGSAPAIASNAFQSVKADVYYSASDSGWTSDVLVNYGGTLKWNALKFSAPVLTEAFNSSTGVRVSWKTVTGATKYRLLRKLSTSTTWTNVGETTECSLIDKTAKSGSRYTYTVECINGSGAAVSAKDETGRTCTYIAMAKITSVGAAENGMKIVWAKPTGAKNFRVMRKVDGESKWTVLTDVLGDSYVDTTAEPGIKYWYTVRAITIAGDMYTNSYNSIGWSGTLCSTPVLTEAFNSSTGVRVSWKEVTGATKYRLLRKGTSDTEWSNVGETTECSLIDTTAKSASRYTYTVECINGSGVAVSGRNETGRTCTYIALAKITSTKNTDEGISITWAKPAGAKNFRVMRKVDGESKWTVLTDVLGDSYVDKTVQSGVKYRYTIRAITIAGDMYTNSYNSIGWSITAE